MLEVDAARNRITHWIEAVTSSPAYDPDRPLHRMASGEELLFEDLYALLVATGPKQKRAPSLAEPKHRVRTKDPDTSFVAAISTAPEAASHLYHNIRATLLNFYSGLTDEELFSFMHGRDLLLTPSGVRSRRAELVEAGWVVDSGLRRRTNANRPAIVWRAVRDEVDG